MAIAPQQLGIGIDRRFTRPGVDPYDTVEWERRDARIPNYKDGTDAFFQAEVEFPVSWSQNATNIVAQKYFRGSLGTPEREWSLKQVADRVGMAVLERLRALDHVAYLRFASVYKGFEDLADFEREVGELQKHTEPKPR